MTERDWLAERFEENRAHLRAVAYRMLGSPSEAEDAVQEAWLRLSRSNPEEIENLGGWLTTVVARVCLNLLRSRESRREDPLDAQATEPIDERDAEIDPEREALLADSLGPALLVVLETLAPAERVAFVLHDVFAVPFEEVAPIVGRTPTAARQLASRARRRVQGATAASDADLGRQRKVVDAFLAASRDGDFAGLLAVLDPDVVYRSDPAAALLGLPAEVRGAAAVAKTRLARFAGRAQGAQRALVNGNLGLMWAPGGQPRVVFDFAIKAGKIVAISVIADPERLGQLDLIVLDD
jgi:RNA polymerase sigma-70 factor (ECF subfamily)